MNRLLIAAPLLTLLTACSSMGHIDYDCKLHDVQAAKCASVEDAYKASRKGKVGDRQSVFESADAGRAPGATGGSVDNRPFFQGERSGYPDAAQQGMPVFKQPKVMRVWHAPYVDADGSLRSGEYSYFATPGAWNYGSLKQAGAAANSGMFEPTKPDALGFNPQTAKKPASGGPGKPPEPKASASGAQTSSSGITQPYQRLSK